MADVEQLAAQVEPRLTKYERARIIGLRAQMLQNGSPPLLPRSEGTTPDAITMARNELDADVLGVSLWRMCMSGNEYFVPS